VSAGEGDPVAPRPAPGATERSVVRLEGGALAGPAPDSVAVEEPLEVALDGDVLAVTMRTPGAEVDLALGFLFAEGIISSIDDLSPIDDLLRSPWPELANRIDLHLAAGRAAAAERSALARRGTIVTSACGVCGRRSIEDLLARAQPIAPLPRIAASVLVAAPRRLAERQASFRATGGIHASAALDAAGCVLAAAEDVGRHNAVDKAIGALLRARAVGAGARGVRPAILVVSGRSSFEVVQKAAAAAIPVVAGVSAPSSLAIDLAKACGITLAGFVRDDHANLYAHEGRVDPAA
jgi:FdhD protein